MSGKRPTQNDENDEKTLLDHVEEALGVPTSRPGQKEEHVEQLLLPPEIPG
jgi:hypothetical protein